MKECIKLFSQEDCSPTGLDLNSELVKHPSSTFFARVRGNCMSDEGIGDGDLLVIDKSTDPCEGCLAVVYSDGEFRLKRIGSSPEERVQDIWGVVRYSIKKHF